MDEDRKKVEKASKILEKHEVDRCLAYLACNAGSCEPEGLVWDRSVQPADKSNGDRAAAWSWNGRAFAFEATGRRMTIDGDEHAWAYTLTVNGEPVLVTTMTEPRGGDYMGQVATGGAYLKRAKLGDWVKDLKPIRDACLVARQRSLDEAKSKWIAEQAAEIDLGDFA